MVEGENTMREIAVKDITKEIADMCIQANHYLSEDMDQALKVATKKKNLLWAKDFGAVAGKSHDRRPGNHSHLPRYRYGSCPYGDRTGCAFCRR